MSDGIIVALIGLFGSGFGSLIGVIASSKLTNYRIEQLEHKVEKHNNLIDRTYKLESTTGIIQGELEHINHIINNLEEYHKGE